MRGDALVSFLAALPPHARDAAVERHLGLEGIAHGAAPPGPHGVGYHASGVAPIVRALLEAKVAASDVFVDLGAGLGKVVLLAHLLTGATARGIEIQPELVAAASAAAARLDADVRFTCEDAAGAVLDDGTVFFLYAPFTGPVLGAVLARLRAVAACRAIVVCALAIDLHRVAPWLRPRPTDAFWLTVYDAGPPSTERGASPLPPLAWRIANEEA